MCVKHAISLNPEIYFFHICLSLKCEKLYCFANLFSGRPQLSLRENTLTKDGKVFRQSQSSRFMGQIEGSETRVREVLVKCHSIFVC